MENPSRSSRRKKLGKPSQADDAVKGIYDGVFGGPTKYGFPASLSPRAEDYREVFRRYHAPRVSSIPVLDLQAVDEQVCFDVRKRGFDYSEVFGVFQSLDFADGYEERSSDEARYEFGFVVNSLPCRNFGPFSWRSFPTM